MYLNAVLEVSIAGYADKTDFLHVSCKEVST